MTASSPSQGTWPSTKSSTLFIMSSHQEQPSISGVGLMPSLLLSVCYSLYNYWCGMNGSSLIIEKRLKCWQDGCLRFWIWDILNGNCVYCLAENACKLLCFAMNASSVSICLQRLVSKRFQQEAAFKAVNDIHSGKHASSAIYRQKERQSENKKERWP